MKEIEEASLEILNSLMELTHKHDLPDQDVIDILVNITATLGCYSGDPDMFLKRMKKDISDILYSPNWDQEMTAMVNEINDMSRE